MATFISTFITGFQDVVKDDLCKRFPKLKVLHLFDGLIHYQFDGNSHDLEKITYFNNTFYVLKSWNGKNCNFKQMVNEVSGLKAAYLITKGSFRVRFVFENQFAKVDKQISKKAEEVVLRNSKLQLDRLSPSTEIWYSIRREGFAFCGQLISKREFTEKNLNKGELRPEIAYLICSFAGINPDDVVCEPFCGYGSIPVQLAKKFRFQKLLVSDIDSEKIALVSEKKQLKDNQFVEVFCSDAFNLSKVEDKSVNLVITDPPWGFYEDIGDIKDFYCKMFDSFERILKSDGKIVILSARKEELEAVAVEKKYQIVKSLHTLVNGKKAGLYFFTHL